MEYYSNLLLNGKVPQLTVILCVVSLIVSVALPFVLMAVFKKKYGTKIKAFWFGALVFMVFALIIEGFINRTVILRSGVGSALTSNIWLYATYGGFMAALFEECGRLLCMKFLLKDCKGDKNVGLMYGAGHGGCEAIALFSIVMINNLLYALLINSGAIATTINTLKMSGLDENLIAVQLANISTLITGSSWTVLIGLVERLLAITLHISLSVLVWACVKTGKKVYFAIAFLMHFLTDALVVIVATNLVAFIDNQNAVNWISEGVTALITVVTVLLAGIAYRDMSNSETVTAVPLEEVSE